MRHLKARLCEDLLVPLNSDTEEKKMRFFGHSFLHCDIEIPVEIAYPRKYYCISIVYLIDVVENLSYYYSNQAAVCLLKRD